MTIFVSQRPNTDPEPYVCFANGNRHPDIWCDCNPDDVTHGAVKLAPRPEYTQTRDPEPWDVSKSRPTPMGQLREFARFGTREEALVWAGIAGIVSWAPRHDEFDPPVNRVLAAYRSDPDFDVWDIGFAIFTTYGGEKSWDQPDHYFHSFTLATPAEIDHARRVLSKLAAVFS